jgi:hypothetical protein
MITLGGFAHAGRPLPPPSHEPVTNENGTEAENAARDEDSGDDQCYRLISIEAADAPDGCSGGDWFVYRIAQGDNGITGYRCGNLEGVSANVRSIVTSLNGRRNWARIKPASDRQRRATAAARRAAK